MSALLLKLVNGYKTYSSAILAVVSGLGLVLAQNYSGGVTQIFQALLLLFGGASVVGMRHAIAKLDAKVQAQGARSRQPTELRDEKTSLPFCIAVF